MLEYLRSELRAVRDAPAIVILAVIVAGAAVFFASRAHFKGRIARLNAAVRAQQKEMKPARGFLTAAAGPHRLTAQEKKFLAKALSRAPVHATVYVIEPSGNPESAKCAHDMVETLSQAGWQAHAGEPNLMPVVTAPFWRALPGFSLFVNDRDKTPGAKFLAGAMRVAGFAVRWGGDPRLPADSCELVVGAPSRM